MPFAAHFDLTAPPGTLHRFDNHSASGSLGLPRRLHRRAAPQTPPKFSEVAILMTGPLRTHRSVLHSIREHLIERLGGDLFACLTTRSDEKPSRKLARQEQLQLLADLGGARGIVLSRDWAMEEIIQLFKTSLAHPSDYQAYVSVPGQWRSPLHAEVGHALFVYYEQSLVLRLLRRFEQQNSWTYRWVVYTRSDLTWLAPHPPWESLEANAVLAPWGEDYGGLNDRHAVMQRPVADSYFGRWEALVSGQALRYLHDPQHWVRVHWYPKHVSQERFLWLHLLDHGIHVRRFAAVAAVAACRRGPQCQKGWWRTSSEETGSLAEDAPATHPHTAFKYFQEYRLALNARQRLEVGWRWRVRHGHVELCGQRACFPSRLHLWDPENRMRIWPPNHSSYLDVFAEHRWLGQSAPEAPAML